MSRALFAVALLAIVAGAAAQSTFCEYYTGALFGQATNATLQTGLISAVVGRAASGYSSTTTPALNFPGLFSETLNRGYFNGTFYPNVDFTNTANAAQLTNLVNHLVQFFSLALGCRAATAVNPYQGAAIRGVHANMNINAATETQFINQVAGSAVSFGVPADLSPKGDLYAVATELGLFNRYASAAADAASLQVCSQSDCPLAAGWYQVEITSTGVFGSTVPALFGAVTSGSIAIPTGSYLNFVFPTSNAGITQVSSATGTSQMSGGYVSGTGDRSYTTQYNTAGTYYYVNSASMMTANRLTVVVGGGGMMGSSTGTNGASSLTVGAAVAAATVAAVALLF